MKKGEFKLPLEHRTSFSWSSNVDLGSKISSTLFNSEGKRTSTFPTRIASDVRTKVWKTYEKKVNFTDYLCIYYKYIYVLMTKFMIKFYKWNKSLRIINNDICYSLFCYIFYKHDIKYCIISFVQWCHSYCSFLYCIDSSVARNKVCFHCSNKVQLNQWLQKGLNSIKPVYKKTERKCLVFSVLY